MPSATVKILIISGDSKRTAFMQACDVFEKTKVLGENRILTANFKEGEKVSLERTRNLIEPIKLAVEQSGEIVSFVYVLEIQEKNIITQNNGEVLPYINKKVKCVSNGKNFFVLSNWIEHNFPYLKVITDEYKNIIDVGINTGLNSVKFDK